MQTRTGADAKMHIQEADWIFIEIAYKGSFFFLSIQEEGKYTKGSFGSYSRMEIGIGIGKEMKF